MQKWIFFVLFIGATALGLGVLFGDISDRQAERAAEATGGNKLDIIATNWKFDKAEYSAVKGEPTKINFVNKEGAHSIHIKGEGVDIKLEKNAPSQEVTLAAGTYEIECSIPCGTGHTDMKSKIVVL